MSDSSRPHGLLPYSSRDRKSNMDLSELRDNYQSVTNIKLAFQEEKKDGKEIFEQTWNNILKLLDTKLKTKIKKMPLGISGWKGKIYTAWSMWSFTLCLIMQRWGAVGFSRKITFLITSIPVFKLLWGNAEVPKCWMGEMMKTMHLFSVCHVILTLNLTKGSFCYFKPSWEKKQGERRSSSIH